MSGCSTRRTCRHDAGRCPSYGRAALLVVLVLSFSHGLLGQGLQPTSGVIEGRVLNRDGEPLSNARVVISGPSRRDVHADADGFYRSDQLVEGVYGVEAQQQGHITSLFEGMRLRAGETLRLDFRLAEGKPTSFAMTRMPVVDTRARGARYWLTREDLERLPSAGILRPLVSLLPRSEVVLVDEAELAVPRSEVAGALGLALERLPPELLSSVTVSSADSAPSQRSTDRLQLLTRSNTSPLHGSAIWRSSPKDLNADAEPGQLQIERSSRPTAGVGAVPLERFRLFGGWSAHRDVQRLRAGAPLEAIGAGLRYDFSNGLELERFDRTRMGRLDFGPPEEWELRALWLDTRSEVELGQPFPSSGPRFAEAKRRLRGLVLERVTEGRVGYALSVRSDEIDLVTRHLDDRPVEQRQRNNDEVSAYAELHRGRHLLGFSLGVLDSDLRGLGPVDEDRAWGVGVEDRWSLGAHWVAYLGVRAQRLRRRSAPGLGIGAERVEQQDTAIDPRVSLAWDVGGDGQLGFRFSGGRERSIRPTLPGLPAGDGSGFVDASTEALQPAVDFLAVGGRYQLIPGLTFEGELSQRRREQPRNAGGEVTRLSEIDPLEGVLAGTFSTLSEFRLDEFFGAEHRARFQTAARIGKKLSALALWEFRDFEEGVDADGNQFELGTIQHLRVTGTYRFDNGIGAGAVFSYLEGYGVATPRVGALALVAPGGEELPGSSSLAQIDLSFDYRPSLAPLIGTEVLDLVLRFEVLNALDRRNEPASATALDGRGGRSQLALSQEPRSLWFGVGFAF